MVSRAGPAEVSEPIAAGRRSDNVVEALEDDLNAPLAIAHLHDARRRRSISATDDGRTGALQEALLAAAGKLLGLARRRHPSDGCAAATLARQRIDERIAERALARKERRFADADRIRAELADDGILLEDKPDGTTEWRAASADASSHRP